MSRVNLQIANFSPRLLGCNNEEVKYKHASHCVAKMLQAHKTFELDKPYLSHRPANSFNYYCCCEGLDIALFPISHSMTVICYGIQNSVGISVLINNTIDTISITDCIYTICIFRLFTIIIFHEIVK